MGYSPYKERNSIQDTGQHSAFFYSPFFLQRQTGNKFSFVWAKMEEKVEEDQKWINQNDNLTEQEQYLFEELSNITRVDNNGTDFLDNGTLLDFINNSSLEEEASEEFEYYSSTEVYKHILGFENKNNETESYNNSGFGEILFGPGKFDVPEYGVFGAVLLLSVAIGVFYGCFRKGQKSTDEYLIANRQMSTVPAALSLLCSFISAITILGNPVEIYLYGSAYGLVIITFVPLTITLSYFYVPVFFNLKLTSAYEYFELRFSRSLRTVISLIGILHYVVYISIVVYAPALAIGQVTGINTRMSSIVIFTFCIFYSTLGGLKGVMATDAFQAIVMIGSLITIVCKGTIDLGGPQVVWDNAERFNRTQFLNFDPDPRVRHTMWTSLIGGYMQWLAVFAASFSQVQRYLSMPTLASIRRALLLNLIGFTLVFGLCYWCGFMLFAKYHNCDPIQSGKVSRSDQLLPLFVMESMSEYSGLPGLFIAGIICASASSVSTGLNALSAIVTYDYLKYWMPGLGDKGLLRCSKTFCIIFGVLSMGFMFVVENLGNILPAAFFISGIVLGPTLGIFTLGMFFPWTNAKGSMLGLLSSFFIMITLLVGNQLAAHENQFPDQTIPGLSTDECPLQFSNVSAILSFEDRQNVISQMQIGSIEFQDWAYQFLLNIFSISPMWYPALGCFLAVFFGLAFSIIVGSCNNFELVNPDLLSPPMLWFWMKLCPNLTLRWIDIDFDDYRYPSSVTSNSVSLSIHSPDFSFRKESVCDMQLKRLSILPHQIRFPLPPLPSTQAEPRNTGTFSNATDSLS